MSRSVPVDRPTNQRQVRYIHPTDFEVVASWLHGRISPPALPNDHEPLSARRALEAAVLPAVLAPPCFVAFSGGRDSSAILAVATNLARRHGVADPIPMTELYPGIAESDESVWQDLVVEHLRLRDWLRIEHQGEHELLGASATDSLRQRGVLWPAALHLKPAMFSRLDEGSTLLTGEGGDEVLGRRRGAQVSRLWRRRKLPHLSDIRSALGSVTPEPVRRRRVHRFLDKAAMQPWIADSIRSRHHQLLAADWASEPLSTSKSLPWLLTRRASHAASVNYRAVAAERQVELIDPLLHPRFVGAFARQAGRWGYATRTESMRALFADLLPDAILSRRSKAYFNRAFFGEQTRSFASQWDGTGIDAAMVDAEALRAEWLSQTPSSLSFLLLQSAWLHANQTRPKPGEPA